MAKQTYYEDVQVGQEIPPLVKRPTTRQLVQWAGASDDYYEIHYDKDFAQGTGLSDVIVHGWLSYSFLGQLITDWIGDKGTLVKLGCTYKGMNFPRQDMTCKGKVTKKYVQEGKNLVELEIWTENPKGEATTPGTAIVILPSRRQAR